MHRNFRLRFLLFSGLTLGIVVLIWSGIFFLQGAIKNNADYIKFTRAKLNAQVNQLNDLVRLRGEAKTAESDLPKLRGALPNRDNLLLLPRRLENLAKKYNLAISFDFGVETRGSGSEPGHINFDLNLQGGASNIAAFMEELENGDYFAKLETFDIIRQGDSYSAHLKGEAFFSEEK